MLAMHRSHLHRLDENSVEESLLTASVKMLQREHFLSALCNVTVQL